MPSIDTSCWVDNSKFFNIIASSARFRALISVVVPKARRCPFAWGYAEPLE
jgi:hypothetical protein